MSVPFASMLPSFDVARVAEAIVKKPFPFLDNPMFTGIAFAPRKRERNTSTVENTTDGVIPVEGAGSGEGGGDAAASIVLGYRFYKANGGKARPVFVHFGRNTDIAADCDDLAPAIREKVDAHLLAVDYRGYGWSTGRPLLSALTADTDAVMAALPTILDEQGLSGAPVYLYGAAIGSQSTIYMAHKYASSVKGMVIEAGMSHQLHLPYVRTFASLFPGGQAISDAMPDIYQNVTKLRHCDVPLLVIHGDKDDTVPLDQGRAILDASAASIKRLHVVEGGNHEDLHATHGEQIMAQMRSFVEETIDRSRAMATGDMPTENNGLKRPRKGEPAEKETEEDDNAVGLSLDDDGSDDGKVGDAAKKPEKESEEPSPKKLKSA